MAARRMSRLTVLAGAFLLAAACATTSKPTATAPRDKNSAPEKVAAQRAGGTHELQQLEADDQRWGVEAARERKRQQDEAKARQQPATTGKGVDVVPPAH